MKKPVKILVWIAVVLLVLVGVLLGAVGLFADTALAKAIAVAGSTALKVNVAVARTDLSLVRGKVGLQGLVIDNPKGYESPTLLKLSRGDINVNVRSLLSSQVEIQEIRLDGLELTLEQKGLSSNLNEVINALPKSDPSKPAGPSGKNLVIDLLEITNVVVKAKLLPVPGRADTVTFKLAPIRMQDLGKNGTLDTAALTGKILAALAEGLVKQGAGLLPDDMMGTVDSALGKTAEGGKSILKGAVEAGKGLKGLFKKDSK